MKKRRRKMKNGPNSEKRSRSMLRPALKLPEELLIKRRRFKKTKMRRKMLRKLRRNLLALMTMMKMLKRVL